MAKVSDRAKEIIIADLRNLYPETAIVDKKLYINLNLEGEEVQIAVSLTAPKVKVDFLTKNENPSQIPKVDFDKEEKEVAEIFDFFNIR